MWVKVDDGFPDHEKVFHAASFLAGVRASGRVLAVWLEALCLVNRNHWQGHISRAAVAALRHDQKPLDVAEAMTQTLPPHFGSETRRPGLWLPTEAGFQFHEYHDHNPTPDEIEAVRAKRAAAGRKGGFASGRVRAAAKQTGSKTEATCLGSMKQTGSKVLSKREANTQAKTNPDPDPDREIATESRVVEPDEQDHRAARGTLAVESCGKPLNLLRFRHLRPKVIAPRQLKALCWREVETRYVEDTVSLYEHVKGAAARAGFDYGFQAGFNVRRTVEDAQVRCHIRELVREGFRGFMLAHAVEERLRSQHLITVLDPDSLTRAIEAELQRRHKQKRRRSA